MRYIWVTILVSVFITMTILMPVYIDEVSVSHPVSANVETINSDENPYPAPTELVVPTQVPYPIPIVTCPTPVCTVEYDKDGNVFGTCYQTCFEP